MTGIVQANLDGVLGYGTHGITDHSKSCIFGAHVQSLTAAMVPNLRYHGGVPRGPTTLANVMFVTMRVCLQACPQLEARIRQRRLWGEGGLVGGLLEGRPQ